MDFPERSRIEAKLVPEAGPAPPNVTDSDCGRRGASPIVALLVPRPGLSACHEIVERKNA
jgi:hypothetical protein